MSISTIVLIVLGVIVLWLIFTFNSLVVLRNRVREAWSDIDVQLKRRYDLIPNLVESVKGYAKHEAGVFEKVSEARSMAMGAQGKADKAKAENMLSDTLKSLIAVSESYPDLKANTNFLQLQGELSDTENKIQAARRFYNGNVLEFNNKTDVFPTNIISGMMSFKKEEFFEAQESERQNVQVKF